jgi:type I restriction enzyme S subunit
MSEEKEIPKGWTIVNFSETCVSISLNGIKIKQKQYKTEGKYPVVDQGQELIAGYFDNEELIVPGEPPFIIFGDHTKIKKYINFKFIAGADGVKVLKPFDFLHPKLFFYFLHCIKVPDKGYARHFQFLAKAKFPLPPLPEQHRIVAKIEELFSSLDKGIESLKTAQAQLKVYRQAVLKWAFEGKLTNPHIKDGELPEGWTYVTIGELIGNDGLFVDGDWIESKDQDPNGEVRLIQLADIGDGIFKNKSNRFLKYKRAIELNCTFLKEGDILVARMPDPIGRACIFPLKGDEKFITAVDVAIIRLGNNSIENKFLVHSINNPKIRNEIENLQSGTTRKRISRANLATIKFPVPPTLAEQQRIVSEIESRLSVCDKIEESIATALQQAEALRQSILKKAFEGKLVPQDPNDEPASVLLERIKAEREKNKKKPKASNRHKKERLSNDAEGITRL